MPIFAQVVGDVSFTPGDGMAQPIPRGRVEVGLSDDSATLSWEAGKGVAAVAAIPRVLFEEHVQAGRIVWSPPGESVRVSSPMRAPDPLAPDHSATPQSGE